MNILNSRFLHQSLSSSIINFGVMTGMESSSVVQTIPNAFFEILNPSLLKLINDCMQCIVSSFSRQEFMFLCSIMYLLLIILEIHLYLQ